MENTERDLLKDLRYWTINCIDNLHALGVRDSFCAALYVLYLIHHDYDFERVKSLVKRYPEDNILPLFYEVFERMSFHDEKVFDIYLSGLYKRLSMVDKKEYDEEYPQLLSLLFTEMSFRADRNTASFVQPDQLTKLVSMLLKHYGVKSVYNPFAGTASFCRGLDKDVTYYGQEINPQVYLLGALRVDAKCNPNITIDCTDSIHNWSDKSYDAIVANMPWGCFMESNKMRIEKWFLKQAMEHTKQYSIGIFPTGVLFSMIDREMVIGGDIDTVIQLPAGLFVGVGVQTCIIITNKQVDHFSTIRFIDASTFCSRDGRYVTLDVNRLYDEIIKNEDDDFAHRVKIVDVAKNDFRLDVKRYLQKPIDTPSGFKLMKLKDLVTVKSKRLPVSGLVPRVKIANLNKAPFDTTFDPLKLDKDEYKSTFHYVDEECILVSLLGNLKPTHFVPVEGGIYYAANIEPLIPQVEWLSIPYLINELSKQYVKDQLIYVGSVIHHILLKDLLDISVFVPLDLKDQVSKVSESVAEATRKMEEKTSENKERYVQEIRMRKHAISQVLGDVLIAVEDLEDLKSKQHGVLNDTDAISEDGSTVADYFHILQIAANRVDGMVRSLTDEEQYEEPSPFAIEDAISKYINESLKTNYSVDFIWEEAMEDIYSEGFNGSKPILRYHKGDKLKNIVLFSQKELVQVLDNIFANAKKYGFKDSNRIDYRIRIEVRCLLPDSSEVEVRISNNGHPLPVGMTPEKVFTWGESSEDGTGIGGWQARNIMEHYNGRIQLLSTPNDEYTVTYVLTIPLFENE